jgi:hypothetical protein
MNVMKCVSKRILMVFLTAALIAGFSAAWSQADAASLAAPSLRYINKTYNSVTLNWKTVKGAKSYVIYKKGADGRFARIKVVSSSTLQYKATKLSKGTSYSFMARAAKSTDGRYVSPSSNIVTTKTYSPLTYTISPDSLPCDPYMLRYGYYNSQTRQYYTIRSYMERFEKYGGGILKFEPGTYVITNAIFVPSNVTFDFADGVTLVKGTDTGSSLTPSHSMFQLIRPSWGHSTAVVGGYNGEKNITFKGSGTVVIDMKSFNNSNCIEACHNAYLSISGISFKNGDGGHFVELDANKYTTITNCSFSGITGASMGTREAINLDTPDTVTGGFTASWSNFDKTADYNVLIDSCKFSDMGRSVGTHNYSGGHPHKYIKITNCTMTDMKSYGIGLMNWQNATVTGNKITGSSATMSTSSKMCAILAYGINNCTIKNNTFDKYYLGIDIKAYIDNDNDYPAIYNSLTTQNKADLATNICTDNITVPRVYFRNVLGDSKPIQIILISQ